MGKLRRLLAAACFLSAIASAARVSQDDDLARTLTSPPPDPLVLSNGARVADTSTWSTVRRREILRMFESFVFGKTPDHFIHQSFSITSNEHGTLHGLANRKEITLRLGEDPVREIHLLMYLPEKARHPVPVFVGLNFSGNQTVSADPGITLPKVWTNEHDLRKFQEASDSTRGRNAGEWQVEAILSHGYGLVTAYCGDMEPDFNGAAELGLRALFPKAEDSGGESWGAIGAWAWGLSRIADYLQTDAAVLRNQLALFGHSRLGKAALWAAGQDRRFTLIISNESGMGGASLYRSKTGERIQHLAETFPYWFCPNFREYVGHPERLPVDGNLLLALMAPRPLYVASAEGDPYSSPTGEFLSLRSASSVYRLFGKPALSVNTPMPPLNTPIFSSVGYHERTGPHDVTAFDWKQYIAFADLYFKQNH